MSSDLKIRVWMEKTIPALTLSQCKTWGTELLDNAYQVVEGEQTGVLGQQVGAKLCSA